MDRATTVDEDSDRGIPSVRYEITAAGRRALLEAMAAEMASRLFPWMDCPSCGGQGCTFCDKGRVPYLADDAPIPQVPQGATV